ncbi:MAG: ABC transporter ATP-binding protein [Mycobacteriales bacterium]
MRPAGSPARPAAVDPPHLHQAVLGSFPDRPWSPSGARAPGLSGWWGAVKSSLSWALLARQRGWIWGMLALLLLSVAITGWAALLLVDLVNNGLVVQDVPLANFGPSVVGVGLLTFASVLAFGLVSLRVAYQLEFDLRTWLYVRIQAADLGALDRVASGQLVTRSMTDLALLDSLVSALPLLLFLLPLVLALAVVVLVINPLMGLLAVAALPINLYLITRIRLRLRGLSWSVLNEQAEVAAAIDEPVRGIRVMHAFGRHGHAQQRVADAALRVYRIAMTRARLLARYDLLLKSAPLLINALALFAGAHLVATGALSLGVFLVVMLLVFTMTQVATAFDTILSLWQYLRGAQDRLGEMLDAGRRDSASGPERGAGGPGLLVAGLSVEQPDGLRIGPVDLAVAPGEMVALTGRAAAGMSSLARALAGLCVATTGSVSVDGHPVRADDELARAARVTLVAETPVLFAASLRENLSVRAPGVDEETLQWALSTAGADEIVAALPAGLDSFVGDRGLTLSGGQRQRIALARALVARPRALVLDDALSALHPGLELAILERVRQRAPDIAIVQVTRRPASASGADRVVTCTAEPAERVSGPASPAAAPLGISGLPLDANLTRLVVEQSLSQELPAVDDATVGDPGIPTVRRLGDALRSLIATALAALVVLTVVQTAPAVFLGLVSQEASRGQIRPIDVTALVMGGLAVLGAAAAYLFTISSQRLANSVQYALRRRVFGQATRLGFDFYDRELPGQVATRVVNDLDMVGSFVLGVGFQLVVTALTIVGAFTAILVIAPSVLVTVAMFALLILACTVVMGGFAAVAYGVARSKLGTVTTQFEEDFAARWDIRALGVRDARTSRFLAASYELRSARKRVAVVTSIYGGVVQTLGILCTFVVLLQSGNLVLAGTLGIGYALALQALASAATTPFTTLGGLLTQALNSRVSWHRVRDLYRHPILPVENPAARGCPPLQGHVTFQQVTFRYPHTGQAVLRDVTFDIPAGSTTALVGYTGAGKSSVVKLLQRAYDPDHGRLLVDGIDPRSVSTGSYRAQIGVVPQDDFVFRGTVESNIAYARPAASRAEVEAAARAVGAHDLLAALPGGYDHRVEEAGSNLPRAYVQLIGLARAWLTHPPVLVLDEATSGFDPELEGSVLAALRTLDCTIIAVTHREGVVAVADQVIVLEGGEVAQAGPRRKVIAGGAYERLRGAHIPGVDVASADEPGIAVAGPALP